MSMFYQKPEDVLDIWERLKGMGAQASAYAGIPGNYGNEPGNPYDDTLIEPRAWHPMDVPGFLLGMDTIPMNPEDRIGRQLENFAPMPFLDEGLRLGGRLVGRLANRLRGRKPPTSLTQFGPELGSPTAPLDATRAYPGDDLNPDAWQQLQDLRKFPTYDPFDDPLGESSQKFDADPQFLKDIMSPNTGDQIRLNEDLATPEGWAERLNRREGEFLGGPEIPRVPDGPIDPDSALPQYITDWLEEGIPPSEIPDLMARAGKPPEEIEEVIRLLNIDPNMIPDVPSLADNLTQPITEMDALTRDVFDQPTQDLWANLNEPGQTSSADWPVITHPWDMPTPPNISLLDQTMDFNAFMNQDIFEPRWKRIMKEGERGRWN